MKDGARFALLAVTVAAIGCGGDDGDTRSQALTPTLSAIQEHVFTPSCATVGPCHDRTAPAMNLDLTEGRAHGGLVNQPAQMSPGKLLVVPFSPDESFLLQKLRGDLGPTEGMVMPYDGELLSAETIAVLEQWIADGAKAD